MKAFLLFLMICCCACSLQAQSVKGSWYGVGHIQMDGNTENYLSELVIKQDGNTFKAEFNYYFRDSLFKNKVNCSFNKKTRLLIIQKFPIIYYRSISTKKAVMCDVMGTFELRVAKTGSVINGSLTSATERTLLMPVINYRLIKDSIPAVKTKTNTQTKNKVDASISKQKVDKSIPKTKVAISIAKSKVDTSITKQKVDQNIPLSKKITDSVKIQKAAAPVIIPAAVITEQAFTVRKKDYARIIEVENSKIKLEVYDNGTIDYDSVSLLLNGKLILPKTMLSHHSVKLTIELDEHLEFNELGMFAENLGLIPPNTAALIIRDGTKKYEVTLNSDFTKNAIIQLKTKKGNKKD